MENFGFVHDVTCLRIGLKPDKIIIPDTKNMEINMANFISGLLLVTLAGFLSGGGGAPIKCMRRFKYEHWALISVLVGMLILPWSILLYSGDIMKILSDIPVSVLLKANLFSLSWGVANIFAGLCLVRIGFSLSVGLLTGVGMPIGVLIPMVFRGTGLFSESPALLSRTGSYLGAGVIVIMTAMVFIVSAGFEKNSNERKMKRNFASFGTGLFMAIAAGLLQVGLSFSIVYSQGPINEALIANGVGLVGEFVGMFALILPGGFLINIGYIIWRLCKNNNWNVFFTAPFDILLSVLMGLVFVCFVVLLGFGMERLGVLGASIGFGVYQSMQIAGSQTVGFISGEWRDAPSKARRHMYFAMIFLFIGVAFFSAGKFIIN